MSGQTCKFGGVQGQLLNSADKFMVLDTCGDSGLLHRFANVGLVSALDTSGAAVDWGSAPITVAGGEYRLCWCVGSMKAVSTNLHFVGGNGSNASAVDIADTFFPNANDTNVAAPVALCAGNY